MYVDITDVPVWTVDRDQAAVRMADLDLDVVAPMREPVFVDDEDEFAEHQVRLGYPEAVIATARRECDTVYAEVCGRVEPYGTVGLTWLTDYVAGL